MLAIAAIVALGGLFSQAVASEDGTDSADRIPDRGGGELGLDVFGFSLHAGRSAGFNEFNPGLGLRYVIGHPALRWGLFGDTSIYYDSHRDWAKYVALGTFYEFAESWRAGAAVAYGQSQGYKKGKPFFALVPGLGYEFRRIVFNVVLLPSETATAKIAGLAFYVTVPLGFRD